MKKEEFDMEKKIAELKHKFKMEEIKFEIDSKTALENLKHSNELETGRIKSAEIRKNLERKQNYDFARKY